MNWQQGLFRLWLIGSVVWIAATMYLIGEELCAAYLPGNPFDGLNLSVTDCFPDEGKARALWSVRQWALTRILGVPIGSFALGYALLWSLKGFRQHV